jgi:hypothetical protein
VLHAALFGHICLQIYVYVTLIYSVKLYDRMLNSWITVWDDELISCCAIMTKETKCGTIIFVY